MSLDDAYAASMVAVKVGQQHEVNILRLETGACQFSDQAQGAVVHPQAGPDFGGQLVAVAGIDQDQPGVGFDQQGAGVDGNLIVLVWWNHLLPERARDQAKEAAAVAVVEAVAQNMAADRTDLN